MPVAIIVMVLALLAAPAVLGLVAGRIVRPGPGYRVVPVLALICCIALVAVYVVIGDAVAPQSQCHNTGCDTGYAVGAMFGVAIMYGPSVLGTWLGRRLRPALLF